IFIHGTSATIGCIPIGNLAIEELYWLAALARDHSKEIPVHIFPFRMTQEQIQKQFQSTGSNQELIDFWQGLVPIYNAFESTHKITGTKKQSK
ncbi:MAG: hypothetical protein N2450_00380, partial [bacterium]|nr:hypothetical protein [bacterium]